MSTLQQGGVFMVARQISSESRQIRDYIEGLLKTLESSSDNSERLRIKEDIAKILSDNIQLMSAKDAQRFRDIVRSNNINIDLDELDSKISSSKAIVEEVLDQYANCQNLASKMDLYRQYLNYIDGSFSVLILKNILIDNGNDRAFDTNQVCIDFLIQAIIDLNKIHGNWELNTIRHELIKIISARESVEHSVMKKALYELADCRTVLEKIEVFKDRMQWSNRFTVEALNEILKKCNRRDLSDPLVTQFFAEAVLQLAACENLTNEDLDQRDFLIKRILKVESVDCYLINNNLKLNTAK